MATIQARLDRLEKQRRSPNYAPTPSHDAGSPNYAEGWLDLAVVLAGMAEIGAVDLETGQWTITDETSGPLFLDEFTDGIPAYLTAGKLRQEQGYYFATAPEDDAGRPFYHWLAAALNAGG